MGLFNIRVYGILINEKKQVLVSDEFIRGSYYTKFPGGGLEYGEGTRACLEREFLEELNLRVQVGEHLYTTDYFQKSAFHKDQQIISIYYLVHPLENIIVRLSVSPFDFDEDQMAAYHVKGETESFRFIDWKDFNTETVSLPIDKTVAGILLEKL